jgi:hypothetical protein
MDSMSSSVSQTARVFALTSALLLACGEPGQSSGDQAEGGVASLGSDTGQQEGAEASATDSESDGDTGDTGDTGGVRFDVGSAGGGTDVPMAVECQNVDLLFVIDNSASMQSEQASLVASFGGFVAGIQTALESAKSYHIGVVTTDNYAYNAPSCRSLGALVTRTGGGASSNTDCLPFASGMRYLDDSEPDLASKFACIGQVGISGSSGEMQAEAGYRAVSPALNAAGACNEGFIREDALLIVVIITDEDDKGGFVIGGSEGEPIDWFETFVSYKGGIEENIVVLSLVGGPNNSCGAEHCVRLISMTNMFTNGSIGDICAPSYETFFTDAVDVIDEACTNFTPPG